MWTVNRIRRYNVNAPIMIVGLPGIGNVGKIAADFLVDELKAKRMYSFFSHGMPHSVFVNENNLVELPKIEIFYFNNGEDFLLLTGDVQPIDERACYSFCETVLDLFQDLGGKEIITLGGIGLREVPKVPTVYCTGNSKKMITRYRSSIKIDPKVYGIVGPVMGVAGLILGLSGKRKIEAMSILAETLGHPMYLGLSGSREILGVLNKKFKLKLDFKTLDEEIKSIEEVEKDGELPKKSKYAKKIQKYKEMSYIG